MIFTRLVARRIAAAACYLVLASCAMRVPVSPAQLQPITGASRALTLTQATEVRFSTGYTRVLPAGSHWKAVGTLAQGTVYQPLDTVFVVEGRQVHEAWLVLRGLQLHGFYLPGESKFSPLSTPITLTQGD